MTHRFIDFLHLQRMIFHDGTDGEGSEYEEAHQKQFILVQCFCVFLEIVVRHVRHLGVIDVKHGSAVENPASIP